MSAPEIAARPHQPRIDPALCAGLLAITALTLVAVLSLCELVTRAAG